MFKSKKYLVRRLSKEHFSPRVHGTALLLGRQDEGIGWSDRVS